MKRGTMVLLATAATAAAEEPAEIRPFDSWEFVMESGYLDRVGDNTSADYKIIPTQLTLCSPVVANWFTVFRSTGSPASV